MPYLGDFDQWADIFQWTEAHQDVKWISMQLQEKYGKDKALNPRTIYRYAQRCRERLEQASQLSTAKLNLGNISSLGLDQRGADALQDLRVEMDKVSPGGDPAWPFARVHVGVKDQPTTVEGNEITVNEAKWYVNLKPLAGDLSKADVVLLAAFCDYKERSAVALNKSKDEVDHLYDDVEKYLAFKPWTDEEHHITYMQALSAGTARSLDYIALMGTSLYKAYTNGGVGVSRGSEAYSLPGFGIDYPSELLQDLEEARKADEEDIVGPHPTPLMYLALAKIEFYQSSWEEDLAWEDIPPFRYDFGELKRLQQLKRWDYLWDECVEELKRCLPTIPDPDRTAIEEFMNEAGMDGSLT